MWKLVINVLIYCAVPSLATFGDFFKDTSNRREAPVVKHVAPSTYSVPIFQYGPPKMKFNGPNQGLDKFIGLADKFKKPNFKSISKVSHGPRVPMNIKNFGGPKLAYGPPPPRRPYVQQHGLGHTLPHLKGHCDGWIPILGPSISQEQNHIPEPIHVPEQLHLPEPSFPVENFAPDTSYGPPPEENLQVTHSHTAIDTIPTDEVHIENTVDPGLQTPAILSNELSGGFDIVKSHGIELTNFNGENSFNQLPPAVHAPTGTYGLPNLGHQIPFRPPYKHSPMFHGPKSALGIRYGTVSGNLKAWPIPGTAPKYPLSFREPVPAGLIESIGHNVQHLDSYGVKLHPQTNIYLPPPPSPLPISSLHSLPLKQSPGNFLTHGYFEPQQQAHESNQVAITHQHSCTHGPNLADGFHAQQLVGLYEGAASNNLIVEEKALGKDESSYGPPPSGIVQTTDQGSLPGLDGLNVISAQKSHTVEVPTNAEGGTAYDIQFQQSIASSGHGGAAVNHNQIVNNGLLQSIITAVEQPQPSIVTQADQRADNSDDIKIVFNTTENVQAEKPKADN